MRPGNSKELRDLGSSRNAKGDYCVRDRENALIFSYQVNRLSMPQIKPQCYPRYFLIREMRRIQPELVYSFIQSQIIYLFIHLFYIVYFILFYFISFYFIYYFLSTISIFFVTFFHLFCDNLPCSGMFRNVPECSGMFRNVPCSGFC